MTAPEPKKRGRPRKHPEGYRTPGTAPTDSIILTEAQREWLALQPGGKSATIRRLIDQAMQKNG